MKSKFITYFMIYRLVLFIENESLLIHNLSLILFYAKNVMHIKKPLSKIWKEAFLDLVPSQNGKSSSKSAGAAAGCGDDLGVLKPFPACGLPA